MPVLLTRGRFKSIGHHCGFLPRDGLLGCTDRQHLIASGCGAHPPKGSRFEDPKCQEICFRKRLPRII